MGEYSRRIVAICWVIAYTCLVLRGQPLHIQSNEEEQERVFEGQSEIPRFGSNSPFDDEYDLPSGEGGKRLWARTSLWEKVPELIIEEWVGEIPKIKGKYTLIEFWATWCSQCQRAIPRLNQLHRRFSDELVIISISDEPVEKVRPVKESKIDYFAAVDTQGRMKDYFGVFGLPHAILVEPGGYIVWEGFPLQTGYELTESLVDKILSVSR